MENEIKKQAIKSSVWIILGFGVSQVIRLGNNLVMTRLLIPELFGMMAIVTVIRVGVYMFSELGLKVNVIRHEEGEKPEFINTAWTIQVMRGFVIWLVILFIAFVIGRLQILDFFPDKSVYSVKDLPLVIVVAGFSSIILGFESSNIWLAHRHLTLGKVTLIEIFSQIMGVCVMVSWAMREPTVWALVAGSLVPALFRTLLSHSMLDGEKNYFYLDKKIIIELLHFGKWLLLSAIITFIALNGDRLLLGAFLTAEQLGVYSVAFFLANSLREAVSKLNSKVCYPLLSKANRNGTLQRTYYSIRLKLDFVLFFFVGLLFVISPVIVDFLYDQRYASSGHMMQILVVSLIAVNYRLANFLFLAFGKPFVNTVAVSAKALFLWISVPLLYAEYGLYGALWGIAMSGLVDIPVFILFMAKYKFISWRKEFLFIPMLFAGYFAGLGLIFLKDKYFLNGL